MGRAYECNGDGWEGDHCCYLGGVRCPYLVENQVGRRYACALMLKYGSWESVIRSKEYQPVGDHWDRHPNPKVTYSYCMDFDPAFCCRPEYRNGRGGEF